MRSWWLGQGCRRAVFRKWILDPTGFGCRFVLEESERGYRSQPDIAYLLQLFLDRHDDFQGEWPKHRVHLTTAAIYSAKGIWSGIIQDYEARVTRGRNGRVIYHVEEDKTTVTLLGKPSGMRWTVRRQSKHTNGPGLGWCGSKHSFW